MHAVKNETSMNAVDIEMACDVVGGWDPAASAIAGASTGWAIGNQLLGPVGALLGGLAGLIGGFFAGLFGG